MMRERGSARAPVREIHAAKWTTSLVLLAVLTACGDPLGPDPSGGSLDLIADGFDSPVLLTAAPGDRSRLFIVEKPGRIRIIRDGTVLPAPFLDIGALVADNGEQGLLGLAFHPEYDDNGYFFVNYTDVSGDTRIARYSVGASADEANASSGEIVLTVQQPFGNHNGGHIAFGPDGYLYIGMGDGGDGGDPFGHGQNTATLLGSILRIDVDEVPYRIPASNPFVSTPDAAPETWAFGFRNPWRFSFDRSTGDLWIGDVGQNDFEEVSFQPASSRGGQNYGWVRFEGTSCYRSDPCDSSDTILPVFEYSHNIGCSITGGYVYRGDLNPDFRGRYFFGDLCQGIIWSFRLDDGEAIGLYDHSDDFGRVGQLSSFGEDADGELYVVGLGGSVYRIVDPAL